MHSEGRYGVEAGLVGWWRLFDAATTKDLIGTNDGTAYGSSGYGGSGGRSYKIFNGVDDYVNVPHFSGLNFGTGAFSIALWLRTSDTGYKVICDSYTTTQFAIHINGSPNTFQLYTYGGATETIRKSTSNPITGGWVHIAAVRPSSGAPSVYFNGALDNGALTDNGVQNLSNNGDLRIGRLSYAASSFPACDMSDFRLYNRALSAAEVARLARIY